MKLNDYQEKSGRYDQTKTDLNALLGLLGECGESAEFLKKKTRLASGCETIGLADLTYKEKQHLALELGDVMWYVSRFAERLGYTLEHIAEINLLKLDMREAEGTLVARERTKMQDSSGHTAT